MIDERIEDFKQIQTEWATIENRHHIHTENGLELGLLVKIIQNDIGNFAAF